MTYRKYPVTVESKGYVCDRCGHPAIPHTIGATDGYIAEVRGFGWYITSDPNSPRKAGVDLCPKCLAAAAAQAVDTGLTVTNPTLANPEDLR